jgi:hypothetical protein
MSGKLVVRYVECVVLGEDVVSPLGNLAPEQSKEELDLDRRQAGSIPSKTANGSQ